MQVCFADAGCQTPYHHSVVLPRRDEGLKAHLAATTWLNKKKDSFRMVCSQYYSLFSRCKRKWNRTVKWLEKIYTRLRSLENANTACTKYLLIHSGRHVSKLRFKSNKP